MNFKYDDTNEMVKELARSIASGVATSGQQFDQLHQQLNLATELAQARQDEIHQIHKAHAAEIAQISTDLEEFAARNDWTSVIEMAMRLRGIGAPEAFITEYRELDF